MPTMDQAVWLTVNVRVGDKTEVFERGALLPEAVTTEELTTRALLRLGGAIRVVEVVYTSEELAQMAAEQQARDAEAADSPAGEFAGGQAEEEGAPGTTVHGKEPAGPAADSTPPQAKPAAGKAPVAKAAGKP
jgi:hypothetical protein